MFLFEKNLKGFQHADGRHISDPTQLHFIWKKKKTKQNQLFDTLGYRLNTANYCLKNQRKISPKVSVTKTIQTVISANAWVQAKEPECPQYRVVKIVLDLVFTK